MTSNVARVVRFDRLARDQALKKALRDALRKCQASTSASTAEPSPVGSQKRHHSDSDNGDEGGDAEDDGGGGGGDHAMAAPSMPSANLNSSMREQYSRSAQRSGAAGASSADAHGDGGDPAHSGGSAAMGGRRVRRKRVNVGLELVADPSLIFLDEPTSGLDSTAALELMQALHRLSGFGVAVCAVLHQPRLLLRLRPLLLVP